MSGKTAYRLADSTVAEPLVNKWVAWAHLISPATYGLHARHYQLGVLRSYLEDPRAHARACENPKLRSGRFVDIDEARADEVGELLRKTEVSHRANLELAADLMEFQNLLLKEAKGQSLEPYYEKVPRSLRGYVELVYDYHHRPSVRLLESLLYESPYYDEGLQSFRLFRQASDEGRPFFMSTPRLPSDGQLDWDVPFASPAVDELFRLDADPKPLGYIRELLGLSPADEPRLLPLLSAEPVSRREPWDGSSVRIRYFGHACVLVEWNGISILTDPCIGVMPDAGGIERLTYADLPERIDYALVTHNHQDHFYLESLFRLRHKIECVVVPRSFGTLYGDVSLKLMCRKLGFRQVVELDSLESVPLPGGEIIAIPFMGEHADLLHSKTAYVVRAGGEQILFAADSDCLDRRTYEHIYRIIGPVQTVFIGMECVGAPLSWSCGPLLPAPPEFGFEQTRRYKGCDAARALDIAEALGTERTYVYAMGLEPWLEYLLGLALEPDSPQIQESKKYLATTRGRGFVDAELLFGRGEIHLAGHTAEPFPPEEVLTAAAADAEEQFKFD